MEGEPARPGQVVDGIAANWPESAIGPPSKQATADTRIRMSWPLMPTWCVASADAERVG